jgi:hypothetical protein
MYHTYKVKLFTYELISLREWYVLRVFCIIKCLRDCNFLWRALSCFVVWIHIPVIGSRRFINLTNLLGYIFSQLSTF